MTTAATAPLAFSQLPGHRKAGVLILRIGTAAWIASGAIAKGIEFNPQLLPPPLLKSLIWFAQNTGINTSEFIEWSLRAIVGAEVFIALAILLSARWARAIAMLTLGFFALILVVSMVQTAMKDGIVEALTGSCGCFGEKSPLPASGMLAIDLALLANALFLAPRVTVGGPLPVLIPLVLGVVTTFALPEKEVAQPSSDTSAPTAGDESAPPSVPQPAASGIVGPWPDVPAKYEGFYAPKWADWVGKPLRMQGLALAIERPLPDDLEKGDWIVTFSRVDCEDCQAMYRAHFKSKRPERVLKVTVPDSRGTPLGMPCEGCVAAELFRVRAGQQGRSPTYVFQTPVALRMKDGVVTAVCTDFANAEQVAAVLPPVPGSAEATPPAPTMPNPPTATPPASETPKAKWLGAPAKLESFYIAEFAGTEGKPFAEQPFARLLQGAPPADLLSGRWIVIYYREDCDHCHDLLSAYFTGKLPVRTLLVAIPDTDPANALDNPCDDCVKATLIKGPNYVIGTPVVVAINDGAIECVIENVDDLPALEACLKFPAR
ncbi:MAG: MauE/DoxX family redox-associated membrane protein [Planctomycetota bacterium]